MGSSVVVVAAAGPPFDAALLRHPTTETKTMRCVARRNRRLFIVTNPPTEGTGLAGLAFQLTTNLRHNL